MSEISFIISYKPSPMHRGDLMGRLSSPPWSKHRIHPYCLNSKWRKDDIQGPQEGSVLVVIEEYIKLTPELLSEERVV